jgi:DNA-directed RNA polymerase specialized sigma24 family protein
MDVTKNNESVDLTTEAFELLLSRLAPGPEAAGHEYERLRLNLANYFRLKGLQEPFAVADLTLDRVARLLTSKAVDNLGPFSFGVARLVCLEQYRAEQRQRGAVEEFAGNLTEENEEDTYELMQECLRAIGAEDQELLRSYFQELPPKDRHAYRENLARQAGINVGRLRLRIHRLRQKLENCLHQARGQ